MIVALCPHQLRPFACLAAAALLLLVADPARAEEVQARKEAREPASRLASTRIGAPAAGQPGKLAGKRASKHAVRPGALASGSATLVHGGEQRQLSFVDGTLTVKDGLYTVQADFLESEKTDRNLLAPRGRLLRIVLVARAAGPVDPEAVIVLAAKDEQGLSQHRRRTSRCAIKLTALEAGKLSGSADCPAGMVDVRSKPARPVTGLVFTATTDRSADR